MFTQKAPAWAMRGQLVELLAGARITMGGSSDRAAKDWQVKPTGTPSSMAVTMVMPVAKCPSTSRNRASSRPVTGYRPGRGRSTGTRGPRTRPRCLGLGQPTGLVEDAVELPVVVRGVVVGEHQPLARPASAATWTAKAGGRVAPVGFVENSSSVYWPSWRSRSTSWHSSSTASGDGPPVERRLVVGQVGDRPALGLNPEAQGDAAVGDGPRHHLGRADGEVLVADVDGDDLAVELVHVDGEDRRLDGGVQRVLQASLALGRPVEREPRPGIVQRAEEGDAQNVVEVQMGEQRRGLQRCPHGAGLLVQHVAQSAQTGAEIEDQRLVALDCR